MFKKGLAQRRGRALVEENLHSDDFVSAAGGVLLDGSSLLGRDARDPLDEDMHGRIAFEVLEQGGHRNSSAAEHPGPAHKRGVTLDNGAGGPVK